MSRLNVNNEKGETAQVLPQFRDTKLGKLRFGKQPPRNGGFDMQNNWKMVALYIAVNIVLLIGSLLIIFRLDLQIIGWTLFGIWCLLTLCGIICSFLVFFRSVKAKKKRSENLELGPRISSPTDNIRKLPNDPVMNRAITMLVYHGQEDCEECRLLRDREDFQRRVKEWSVVGSPETFSHVKLPLSGARSQSKNSFHQNGAQGYGSQDSTGFVAEEKQGREIYFENDEGTNAVMFSDESLEDEYFYNRNQSNNNQNANGRLAPNGFIRPQMIITPPSHPTPSNSDDSELRRHSNSAIGSDDVKNLDYDSQRNISLEAVHVADSQLQSDDTPHDVTYKTGSTDLQSPVTKHDVIRDSNASEQGQQTTRKYHRTGRKVPVSKKSAAVTRRRKKTAEKSRISSSSGASDIEQPNFGESESRSPRSRTSAHSSGDWTSGRYRENHARRSRDSLPSAYDDVTYEWVVENFHKRGSSKKSNSDIK